MIDLARTKHFECDACKHSAREKERDKNENEGKRRTAEKKRATDVQ